MNTQKIIPIALYAWMVASASQTAYASKREKNTWIGIGVGALAGGFLSKGDPVAMLGGAAAGGLLFNLSANYDRDPNRFRGREGDHRNNGYRNYRDRTDPDFRFQD